MMACGDGGRGFHPFARDSDAESDNDFSSEEVSTTTKRTQRNRLHFSVEELQKYYHLPLKTAAKALGICEAALKRICRRNNIHKWPYRRLQSVMRRIDETSRKVSELAETQQHTRGFDFLLPHELEHRRKTCASAIHLSSNEFQRTARLQELKLERQLIIKTAHDGPTDMDVDSIPGKNWSDPVIQRLEQIPIPGREVIMADSLDLESPLELLASLCVQSISPSSSKRANEVDAKLLEMDIKSVHILCLMTETPS